MEMYNILEDDARFKKLLEQAEGGDMVAQFQIGDCYNYGRVPSEEDGEFEIVKKALLQSKKAVPWYTKAALQGHSDAQNELANCYRIGTGVRRDQKNAVVWFEKAAEQGNKISQYYLSFYYYYGDGVPQDSKKARQLLELSAAQGFKPARDLLFVWFD